VLCSCVPASSESTPSALTAITSKDNGASRPDDDDDDDETTGTTNPGGTTKPGNTFPPFWTTATTARPGATGTATTARPVTTGVNTTATTATTRPTTGTTSTTSPGNNPLVNLARPGFEDVDFYGYTFTFASPINDTDGWHDYEVYAEEDGTGALDAAINRRNSLLLEHYDCMIKVEDINNGTLKSDFATGQNNIDIALFKYNMHSKATTDYYNFYDLGIDLTKPWWDQGFIKDATVNGQIYTMLGAFSLTSFDATWVMYFNKNVKESTSALRGEDFYQLVYSNQWTLDKFFDLSKKAMHDDGDQWMSVGSNDVFGYVSTNMGIRGLYFGAGQGYVVNKNNSGTTQFAHAFTSAAIEATNKILDIYDHDSTAITDYVKVESQFRSDTVLFAPEVLRKAAYYSGKEGSSTERVNFGILPHPKLSGSQQNFKHNMDNHVIYMTVPTTCTDIVRMRNFLELYAYHSYYTVYREYINLYNNYYTTDADSAAMVEIILNSRSFDLAYQFSLANVDNEYINSVRNGTNMVSTLAQRLGGNIVSAANTYRDKLPGNK
jgi:hypothetical protein